MYDLRRLLPAKHLVARAALCGFGLAAVSLSARAELALDAGYSKFRSELVANELITRYGGLSGSPMNTGSGLKITGSPGGATLSKAGSLGTKYGRLGFNAFQRFSLGSMARGVGLAAGGPIGVALLASPYILDWVLDSDPDFSVVGGSVMKSGDQQCTAVNNAWGSRSFTAMGCEAAAQAMTADLQAAGKISGGYITKCVPATVAGGPPGCGAGWDDGTNSMGVGYVMSYPEGSSPEPTEATAAEIEEALAGEHRSEAELEEILKKLLQEQTELAPDPADVPAASPEAAPGNETPEKVETGTKTNPDGSTEETTKRCRAVLVPGSSGSAVKVVEECSTTVVRKAADGSPLGTTTEESTSEDSEATKPDSDEGGFCDSLVGKLVCSDLDTPEAEPIDKTTKTLTYAPENHFGGGACPADAVMTTHNGRSLKVWDWAASCDKINQFFRPLFLTLCAFTALMILAPAVKEA